MTPEQAAAYVFSQAVAALAKIEKMRAGNAQHPDDQPYPYKEFESIVSDFGIGHNAVVALFNEANAT